MNFRAIVRDAHVASETSCLIDEKSYTSLKEKKSKLFFFGKNRNAKSIGRHTLVIAYETIWTEKFRKKLVRVEKEAWRVHYSKQI